MKLLLSLTGGYKRVMDRLLGLQAETQTFINAQYSALGYDIVLSVCAVTDNGNGTVNIASGIIYLGGDTLRYDGGVNIAADGSQAFVRGGAVTSYPSIFGDGSTKNIYTETKAVVAAQDPTNQFQIKIGLSLYNLQQYIKDQINASEVKGTIKEIYDLDGTFLLNFDTDGLGVTPAWTGWALDNGNFDTPGSAGKVIVGAGVYTDPVSGLQTTFVNRATDGEISHVLTIPEMPSHSHPQRADIYNNAAAGTTPPAGQDGSGTRGATLPTGGDQPHNNMQPYNVAYRVVKIV